jgi:hypothetical protein
MKPNKRLIRLYKDTTFRPVDDNLAGKRKVIVIRHHQGRTFWGNIAKPKSSDIDEVT